MPVPNRDYKRSSYKPQHKYRPGLINMLPTKTGGIFSVDFTEDSIRQLLTPVDPPDAQKSISEKIVVIEKWLQHGMSRFSKETLQSFLAYLMDYVSNNPTSNGLRSISDLQKALTNLKLRTNGNLKVEDRRLIAFFNNFMHDLEHIKAIKRAYDTEIFDYLYSSFYDSGKNRAESESRKSQSSVRCREDLQSGAGEEELSISPRRIGVSTSDMISGDADEKLSVIVRELSDIKSRWDNLLLGDQEYDDNFDPDSKHELHHLSTYERYEPILRLVPDMFTKCYKCVELAKQWLKLAPKVYTSLPLMNKSQRLSPAVIRKCDNQTDIKTPKSSLKQSSAPSSTIQSPESPLVKSVERPPRPQTSKPKSSSSSSHRNRIVIMKPRVAKYKPPEPNQSLHVSSDFSDLGLNLELDDITEGHTQGVHSDQQSDITHEKPYVNGDSNNLPESSATVGSGTISSGTLTVQPSDTCSADISNSDYTDMMVKLRGVNRNIDDLELNLQRHKIDKEVLKGRSGRISGLEKKYQSAQEQLEGLQESQESDKAMFSDIEGKYVASISGTSKFFEYENSLKELKNRIHQREMQIKLLTFKIGVIEQDFSLEADMEPNFECIERDLEFEIQETQKLLEQERIEKLELERDMALQHPKLSARNLSGSWERELTMASERSGFSETISDYRNTLVKHGSEDSIRRTSDNGLVTRE